MYAHEYFFRDNKPVEDSNRLGGFCQALWESANNLKRAIQRADLINRRGLALTLVEGDTDAFMRLYNDYPENFITPALACLLLEANWKELQQYLDSINPRTKEYNG